MKIAIIGSGISGMTCAHYLYKTHNITLFEANDYIGGHTATVDVPTEEGEYAVDTGFIVFNDRTYPNFQALMGQIGIGMQPTEMSFSVRNETTGLEYNGHNLVSLFAQKRNAFNPRFYRFIAEILRFNRIARESFETNDKTEAQNAQTLGEFLQLHEFSAYFCQHYILPMGAAIWSSTLSDMRNVPLMFFLQFFQHHGLLDIQNRPQWFVIPGGSREYIKKLTRPFLSSIRLNCPVSQVTRTEHGVTLTALGKQEDFDAVIFACHSDQALAMLGDPTAAEMRILGAIPYQDNRVTLHTDASLLPHKKRAWASWNYHLGQADNLGKQPATLTYNMNILQQLDADKTFCVSLNQEQQAQDAAILRRFVYAHPVFTQESIQAQQQRAVISGVNHSWFCGAYWYNGFHEDGVRSALDVVAGINNQASLRCAS